MARTSTPKKTAADTSKTKTRRQKSSTASNNNSILNADKNDNNFIDLSESVSQCVGRVSRLEATGEPPRVAPSLQEDSVDVAAPLVTTDKTFDTIDAVVTTSSDGVQSGDTALKCY
ncbi:MAG: hypothetical protein KME29_05450 [Calothrix sp. FI2-JRJ7]|jgi:hypothetical protein|nr:hypothetical protein [Calothrix sp. FI2-JRJ7]